MTRPPPLLMLAVWVLAVAALILVVAIAANDRQSSTSAQGTPEATTPAGDATPTPDGLQPSAPEPIPPFVPEGSLTPTPEGSPTPDGSPTPTSIPEGTPTPTATPAEVVEVVKELSGGTQVLSSSQTFLLVLAAVIGSFYLMGAGVIVIAFRERQPHPDNPGGGDGAVNGHVSLFKALTDRTLQGATLVMVILAVFILGLQGKLTDEGMVGVFGAIVGYVLGRGAPKDS